MLVWNLVGAGLFGFLINPPLALYYMQGLNTTATHGHAALFGVYGMLGIGLTLFCMRGLSDPTRWSDKLLKTSFWCLNIGLAMMVFLSLFPQGLLPGLPELHARLCLCAQRRGHPQPGHAGLGLGAGAGRPRLYGRRRRVQSVHGPGAVRGRSGKRGDLNSVRSRISAG